MELSCIATFSLTFRKRNFVLEEIFKVDLHGHRHLFPFQVFPQCVLLYRIEQNEYLRNVQCSKF